jgi:hypothetical protein
MVSTQEDFYNIADVFMPGFKDKYYEYLETGNFKSEVRYHPFPTDDFVHSMATASLNS